MSISFNIQNAKFSDLLLLMADHEASDLHLQIHSPPILRILGSLIRLDSPPLDNDKMEMFLKEILTDDEYHHFHNTGDLDVAVGVPGKGRVRINVFRQRGNTSLAARLVKSNIPTFEELNLPEILGNIADYNSGFVIVAGPTGSGKSTSLAAMIEHVNSMRDCHILTIEDPIEYLYANKKAYISQREVGIDVSTFARALKYAMREDPDIMLIGEMRDSETIEFGLAAAETGHLVFGTLHSSNASQTFGRVLDFFKADEQDMIRQGLYFNLRAIICQKLLPTVDGKGRVPALEILINNSTVRELIQKKQDIKLPNAIMAGVNIGMQDFNSSLASLYHKGLITKDMALHVSSKPEALEMKLKGISLDDERAIF
ncbi:MAG: PilT/PilU family type 4a pilus ATPase [Candidatus Theseobacter exili]|nr:PilT/PilU family type 4a pilus ATPase [Candidatus Theseobacter exili]